MPGTVSFHFDDGFLSHYEKAFPVFREFGAVGCLSVIADRSVGMPWEKILEMQENGWEILCHSLTHPRMSGPLDEKTAAAELLESKKLLTDAGFRIRQFVTPCSQLHPSLIPAVQSAYDAAFTEYTNSLTEPIETLVERRPVNRYALHRACLSGKTAEELKAYIDYAAEHDAWLVFYDHDLECGSNVTVSTLRTLLAYLREKDVAVLTSSDALAREKCRTKILTQGWDGKKCFVHARLASDGGDRMLITAQKLNVAGSDCFDQLNVSVSSDGGQTFSPLCPDPAFTETVSDGIRSVCCDMTPFFHKKTGKFLATGHIAQYYPDALVEIEADKIRRMTPYAVFNGETGRFSPFRCIRMPDPVKYGDSGSGCSQICETPSGELLIPFCFSETVNGVKQHSKAAVMRCSFDGETVECLEIGNELSVPDEVRGIGECSVIAFDRRYFLTVRGDTYGYVCVSSDGLHYTDPCIWRWEDGEIVPTYNTQSHFMTAGGVLYLVYTRKNGNNDHVFRHRAPLFAAQVDPDALRLKRETEFIAVPERGARLGNFGACAAGDGGARIIAAEWMQPAGCEAYGSDNAIWLTDVSGRS